MAKRKPDPAASLAEQMQRVLESQGRVRDEQPPLTLGQLGRLADAAAADDTIVKAAGKLPFKERSILALGKRLDSPVALVEDAEALAASDSFFQQLAEMVCSAETPVVSASALTKKVAKPLQPFFAAAVERRIQANRFPATLALVALKKKPAIHLREYPLPKPDDVRLAESLVAVLKSQRDLGGASYPSTLQRLVELTQASASLLKSAMKLRPFATEVVMAMKGVESPVALVEDRAQLLASPLLLETALRAAWSNENQAAAPAELSKKVVPPLAKEFEEAIEQALVTRSLPASIGWLRQKKKPLLFFFDEVQRDAGERQREAVPTTSAAERAAPADFARLFDEAFQRLDRARGSHNFVSLVDLRRDVPRSRQVFDDELRQLRLAGRYMLELAEGRQGLSPAEQEAGILENGSLLLYVSRKL